MVKPLRTYDVTVWDGDAEWIYRVQAEDDDHAREQAMDEDTVLEVRGIELREDL